MFSVASCSNKILRIILKKYIRFSLNNNIIEINENITIEIECKISLYFDGQKS